MKTKIKGLLLTLGILLGSFQVMIQPIFAESSHRVAIQIAEICRYRVEENVIQVSNKNEEIYQLAVAVLSNSKRQWNFLVLPDGETTMVEWSADGRRWNQLAEATTVLTGSRSNWGSYHFYFRTKNKEYPGSETPINVKYQILYEE